MSSNIVDIPDEDVETRPPSEPLSCNNNSNGLSISNTSTIKRNNYMKQRGRRRRWWYFNRGLQPISEVAEIKDDHTVKCERTDDSPLFLDDPNVINNSSSDDSIISSYSPQNKEGYSACLKVIEKFQEVVMDSAVRVIQAAFKRFRERRRFLRIKKAVMVIQRNLRKWLESKHPCIRPANFERQSSDGSKSDEYRKSTESDIDGCATQENDIRHNLKSTSECDKYQENNDISCKGNSVDIDIPVTQKLNKANNIDENLSTCNLLHEEKKNTDLILNLKSGGMEPNFNNCLPGREEEFIDARSAKDEKTITDSEVLKQEKLVIDVKLLLEELLLKVISSSSESEEKKEESQDVDNEGKNVSSKHICTALNLSKHGSYDTEAAKDLQNNMNMNMKQNVNYKNKDHNKILTHEEKERYMLTRKSPDPLKVICQSVLDLSNLQNLPISNMESQVLF